MKMDVKLLEQKFVLPTSLTSLFPGDAVKPKQIEDAIREAGTYHEFGGKMYLSETDIRDFIDFLAVRRSRPQKPAQTAAGLLIFIGSPTGNDVANSVWLGWAPVGQELDVLEKVQIGAREHVMILATEAMTYGEVVEFKKKHRSSRTFGDWYLRTDEVMSVAEAANQKMKGLYDE